MGSFETRQFMQLMKRCPNLYLDTTMAFAPIHHEYRRIDTRLNRISVTNDDLVRCRTVSSSAAISPSFPIPTKKSGRRCGYRDLPRPVYDKIFHDNRARLLGLREHADHPRRARARGRGSSCWPSTRSWGPGGPRGSWAARCAMC
jgi:hypothetical protein